MTIYDQLRSQLITELRACVPVHITEQQLSEAATALLSSPSEITPDTLRWVGVLIFGKPRMLANANLNFLNPLLKQIRVIQPERKPASPPS